MESDPCVTSCDGEDRQTMALADEERQRSLLAADVDVDKPSGSTAEASQGCDQESFIAKSDFLKDVSDDDFDANDFRLSSLAKAFADHQTIEASESRSCRGAPSTHVRMGVYGNLKAALAFSKTCALDRAMKSNQKTGQRPLNPDTMMNSLFVHAKPEDRQAFKEALPWGSQIYAANGAVTSLEMDDLKVPNNDEKCDSNIDSFTMSRRRCTRLTNEKQWRVMLHQRETRESGKRKKAQNDENRPAKVYKPCKTRVKKQKP